MPEPPHGDTLQLVAGELHAIGQRLTYLGSLVQAQAAAQTVAAPAPGAAQAPNAPQVPSAPPPQQP
ncbi:pyruvate dehydrogenase complex dihydrolipoyllysine-residue acetyltransferase, partial [Saccharopolyspora hordei]